MEEHIYIYTRILLRNGKSVEVHTTFYSDPYKLASMLFLLLFLFNITIIIISFEEANVALSVPGPSISHVIKC